MNNLLQTHTAPKCTADYISKNSLRTAGKLAPEVVLFV